MSAAELPGTRAAQTVDDLLRLADEALMAAKVQGRNRIVISGVPVA